MINPIFRPFQSADIAAVALERNALISHQVYQCVIRTSLLKLPSSTGALADTYRRFVYDISDIYVDLHAVAESRRLGLLSPPIHPAFQADDYLDYLGKADTFSLQWEERYAEFERDLCTLQQAEMIGGFGNHMQTIQDKLDRGTYSWTEMLHSQRHQISLNLEYFLNRPAPVTQQAESNRQQPESNPQQAAPMEAPTPSRDTSNMGTMRPCYIPTMVTHPNNEALILQGLAFVTHTFPGLDDFELSTGSQDEWLNANKGSSEANAVNLT